MSDTLRAGWCVFLIMGKSIEEQRAKIRNEKSEETKTKPMRLRLHNTQILFRGIYFLYFEKEIVYIGKSENNVMKRICEHFDSTKVFDSFQISEHIKYSDKQLSQAEKKLIQRYKPKYNIVYKRKTKKGKQKKKVWIENEVIQIR